MVQSTCTYVQLCVNFADKLPLFYWDLKPSTKVNSRGQTGFKTRALVGCPKTQ